MRPSTCANDRLEFVDAIVFFLVFYLEFIFSAYISLSVQTMVSNLKLLLILKRGKIVGFPLFNLLVAIFIYYLHGWFIEILLKPLQINWTVLFFSLSPFEGVILWFSLFHFITIEDWLQIITEEWNFLRIPNELYVILFIRYESFEVYKLVIFAFQPIKMELLCLVLGRTYLPNILDTFSLKYTKNTAVKSNLTFIKTILKAVMMMMNHYPMAKCSLASFNNKFMDVLCRKIV